jgi:hypothetical protein
MKSAVILLTSTVVVIFLLLWSRPSESVDDAWVCPSSVALAFYYHTETDLLKLQEGIWSIIQDPELDNAQTYVYLTVFHTVQQIAHNIRANPEVLGDSPEEFWLDVLNRVNVECEYLLNEQRFPSDIR